mmetsp:Transcript_7878/g.20852  ORF Transcript_7878/g.20852 Transcript_7878/m.20852 type:complete len:106 (+) Transcript_7878:221-538(+)
MAPGLASCLLCAQSVIDSGDLLPILTLRRRKAEHLGRNVRVREAIFRQHFAISPRFYDPTIICGIEVMTVLARRMLVLFFSASTVFEQSSGDVMRNEQVTLKLYF